eukprot:7749296-Ditylum_brightwellii.AAC.1
MASTTTVKSNKGTVVTVELAKRGTEPDRIILNNGMEDYPEEIWQLYEEEAVKPEAEDYMPEELDKYISAQVMIPLGDSLERATVVSWKRDANGIPIGLANNNPLLDTRMYDVRFNDGT